MKEEPADFPIDRMLGVRESKVFRMAPGFFGK